MNRPKVSILIPVYNVEKYIERCVTSILNQSYPDYEVILINDGSTDSSGEVCDQICLVSDKVKVFHTNNQGVSRARNLALSKASGEYITFIDSDDYVSTDYIAHLVEGMDESCGLVQAGYIKKRNDITETVECTTRNIVTDSGNKILRTIRGFVWSKLFKRDIVVDNSIVFRPSLTLAEDLCFVLEYLCHIGSVSFIKATDYYYEDRDSSASKKIHKVTNLFSQICVECELVDRLMDKWPKAISGLTYRHSLLAKSVFNLLSNLYQYNPETYIWNFLSVFPTKYSDLLKFYSEPKILNRLVARLAYKRKWKMLYYIFQLKRKFKN